MAQQFDYPKTETELRKIQDKLYQHSKEAYDAGGRPAFKGLLEIMSAEATIVTAIHNIKSNRGSETPGVDSKTMRDYLQKPFPRVVKDIQKAFRHFEPQKIRRKYIDKPGKAEKRPLGIPTIRDRIVQECMRIVLEPIFEAQFFAHSYGFRPMRSASMALKRITSLTHSTGYHWIVEGDISKCFDRIDHTILLKRLYHMGVKDRRVLQIIKAMLKAGVMGECEVNEEGTPQGGLISPLLANVYLDIMDEWITGQWENKHTNHTYSRPDVRLHALQKTSLTPGYLVRYADDFVIITDTRAHAEAWKARLQDFLQSKMKLTLSQEKTLITDTRRKYIKFLGFEFKNVPGKARKGYITRTIPDRVRLKRKVDEIAESVKKIPRNYSREQMIAAINRINSQVRGIIQYYQCCTWVNISMQKYARRLQLIAKTRLKQYKGKWIPANETQNLPRVHQQYKTKIFWNKRDCSLTILKQSTSKEPLTGAVFHVTDEDGAAIGTNNGRYTTDRNGLITITGLQPGQVLVVTEEKAPNGYVRDMTPKTIKIKQGVANSLIFENAKAGSLVINKRSSVDKKTPLEGVTFKITTTSGEFLPDENGKISSNGLYYTDENGQIILKSVVGTLVVTEQATIDGYTIHEANRSQTVEVKPDDTQTLYFYNDPLCSLTLTKLDSVTGKPVPNTEFTVKDGNGNIFGRYTTGKDGTVVVTGLIPGSTVVVSESRVPDGYVLDTTPQTIIVQNGSGNSWVSGGSGSSSTSGSAGSSGGNNLTFENDPKVTLTIHKYIEGTANEPLAGVAFKITDGSGAAIGPDGGVYYTNSAGEIVVEGLEPGTTVTAREIKTVDGYVLDGNPQTVKIEAGKGANLTFWNKPAGSLIIRKPDKLTGKPLAGVEFELVYAKGGYVDTDNGHLSSNGIYTTNDHGEIHISGVTGTIVVKETRPLPGYTIEPGRESQTVTVNPQDTQTLTFYNIPANTLTINKYIDGTENTPLAGVQFLVTDSTGAVVGPNNGYYTTDKDGRISIPGLTPGTTITVKETKTLDGYILDGQPQTITIKEGEAQSLTFWNKKAGGLIVNKVSSSTKEPLAGVKFKICYADGTNVDMDGGKISSNGIYTTDSQGQIKILGIVGTVVVEEIETIPGYIIDPNAKSQTVKINANDTQTITFTNTPKQTLVIQKLVTGTKDQPLAGVEFLVTDSSGATVGPNNGIYRTDAQGRITISDLTPGMVITAKETKALDGYVLDGTPQSMEIKSGEVQTLTFYNAPVGGLELIKVSESDRTKRIPNVKFEIRKMDGGLVTTVTTDSTGRVHVDLDVGDYYAVEIEAAKGFKIDETPQYFTIRDNETTTLTVTNKAFSGILIHKIDSVTKKGIYGVTFLLYDSTNTPVGQYTSDNSGYVYIEGITTAGRYYLRELENEGYITDTQMKTVYVNPGETTLVEWENTPITGQIQITKKSADYNSTNGLPAGTLLEGAVFEIYDKASNLVDTIKSDSRGLAVSRQLPLGRYTIRETKAPANYGVSDTELTAYLEHEGQIVRFEVTNKAMSTGVAITKTGPKEAMVGQPVNYTFSGIANSSNVRLDNFYWRDTLPAEVRLSKIVTGTYNFPGTYKITYRVNGGELQTLADNLSTQKNYTLAASPTALGLASNERVTEVMFVFGQAPGGFAQVEKPMISCIAISGIRSTSFVNKADVGGTYNGVWVQAISRWVTTVYGKPVVPKLPRTGY